MEKNQSSPSKKGFFGNSIWNLFGQFFPMMVAVVTIPILIHKMGTDRFAIVTLVWMITGYMSIFDFGLGRALTQMVSEKIAKQNSQEIPAIIHTVTLLMFAFGLLSALIFVIGSPWIIDHFLKIPPELQSESRISAYVVALSLPFVIASSSLRGAIEGAHRFDLSNLIRLPIATLSYLLPALLMPFTQQVTVVVAVAVFTRVLNFFLLWHYCRKVFPGLHMWAQPHWHLMRPLLGFGSWMTVSNVISPIMSQMDRFYVGAVVSLSAVAYYSTPVEMVTKVSLLSVAICGVLFPSLASDYAHSKEQALLTYQKGYRYIFILTFPLIVFLILFARESLQLWLGPVFAEQSYQVLQWLALGIFINGMTMIPYTFLQAAGRPDLTAKIHVLELPVYLATLWLLTKNFGINGTAIAWGVRASLDFLLLFYFAHQVMAIPLLSAHKLHAYVAIGTSAVALFLTEIISLCVEWPYKILYALIFLVVFALLCFHYVLSSLEKNQLLRWKWKRMEKKHA